MANDTHGVVILAGGWSERMKFPKAYLEYQGKTFLQNLVDEYFAAGINNICVVLNHTLQNEKWNDHLLEAKKKATIVVNPDPELGRLHSIKLGIRNMLNLQFCFIQNVDSPFVNRHVINRMLEAPAPEGYISPTCNGISGHPVLISRSVMLRLNSPTRIEANLRMVLSGFKRATVEVKDESILENINTAEDYRTCGMKAR